MSTKSKPDKHLPTRRFSVPRYVVVSTLIFLAVGNPWTHVWLLDFLLQVVWDLGATGVGWKMAAWALMTFMVATASVIFSYT